MCKPCAIQSGKIWFRFLWPSTGRTVALPVIIGITSGARKRKLHGHQRIVLDAKECLAYAPLAESAGRTMVSNWFNPSTAHQSLCCSEAVFQTGFGPHGPSVGQMVGKLPGVVTLTCVGSSFVPQLYGYLAFYPQSVVEITGLTAPTF